MLTCVSAMNTAASGFGQGVGREIEYAAGTDRRVGLIGEAPWINQSQGTNVTQAADPIATIDSALAEQVNKALQAPWYRLVFPRDLEARFLADGDAERSRYLRRMGAVGALLFGSFLITDAELLPDVFRLVAILRLTFIVGALASLSLITRKGSPIWLRESAMTFYSVWAVAAVMIPFALSHSPDRAAYLNGILLILFFGTIILQPRFPYVVVTSVLGLSIVLVGLASGGISAGAIHAQIGITVTSIGVIIATVFRLEQQQRRSYLLGLREARQRQELLRNNALLLDLSQLDGLTGLANRRALDKNLVLAWQDCAARGQPLGLVMIDVDFFKAFNDIYGHLAGDNCLRDVAAALREQTRIEQDTLGRYGGEEFLAVLPGKSLDVCLQIGERMRQAVETLSIEHRHAVEGVGVVTVSLGIACAQASENASMAALLNAADAALYAAKHNGRNRVWHESATAAG